MKTVFRSLNIGLILAAVLALGAVATFAEDPCTDATGQGALYDSFLAKFPDKSIAGRKAFVEIAKQYVQKYGSCESTKTNTEYFNNNIPKWETTIKTMEAAAGEKAVVDPFNAALASKNPDSIFSTGKVLLQQSPDKYRSVEIALAAIGGEESLKGNAKFNDDALRFAKQSIADLEANKSFTIGDKERYGLGIGEFPNKADALAWLNLYAGYITASGQKNKLAALPYLYKASQATGSDTSKKSIVYDLIGSYYFDELKKVAVDVTALQKQQEAPGLTEDQLKAIVEQIKAKDAMAKGTALRVMDAYARAYTLEKDVTVKAKMKGIISDAYNVRFGNTTGIDAWIAGAVTQPFVNPSTPIAPISDAEPVKTEAVNTAPSGTVTTSTTTVTTPAKGATTTTVKTTAPANTTTTKPATKPPTKPAKPAVAKKKKTVVKKAA